MAKLQDFYDKTDLFWDWDLRKFYIPGLNNQNKRLITSPDYFPDLLILLLYCVIFFPLLGF